MSVLGGAGNTAKGDSGDRVVTGRVEKRKAEENHAANAETDLRETKLMDVPLAR
jgi:hypothetical protein